MKKLVSLIISLVLVLSSIACCYAYSAIPDNVKYFSDAGIVIDMTTGDVLYAKNENEKMYPASITKIMTAIVTLETYPDLEGTVTVSKNAAGIGGNSLNLKANEKLSLKDLLYGTMVISANDGAVALAEYVAGSVEEFVKLMNKKAEALGCTGTHYANPNGLHDDDHYTTASDIAIIAKYCMQNETFREIVSSVSYTVPATNLSAERTVENTNWLLYSDSTLYVQNEKRAFKYDGCIGIKTGSTLKAGYCLVTAAVRGNTTVLAVTLHASGSYERFADGITLLDLGLNNYRTVDAMTAGTELGVVNVKKGSVKTVTAVAEEDLSATLESSESSSVVTTEVELYETVDAPISKGAIIGKVSEYRSGELIAVCNAVAAEDVPEGGFLSNFGIDDATAAKIFKVLKIIGIIVLVLILALAAWVIWKKEQIKRKKARKAARAAAREEMKRKAEEDAKRNDFLNGKDDV